MKKFFLFITILVLSLTNAFASPGENNIPEGFVPLDGDTSLRYDEDGFLIEDGDDYEESEESEDDYEEESKEEDDSESGEEESGEKKVEEIIDENVDIADMLFAYSIVTASDEELQRQAKAHGITSDYKKELLKLYGITRSEETIKSFFEKKEEGESGGNYSFKVKSADRIEKLQSEEGKDSDTFLYGNVEVAFSGGGESKTLKADAMALSFENKVLMAYGNISVSDSEGSALQDINSSLLVFTWDANNLTLYDAVGAMNKSSSGNAEVNYFMSADRIVFDNETNETYFKNATLSTNRVKSDSHWQIDADEIIMKGTGDIFLTLMFLKIGRVPILPLPALFMPGKNLIINPAVGFSSDKGAFVNMTLDVFGELQESSGTSTGNSFTSLFSSDTNASTVKKEGLMYVKNNSAEDTALEKWAKSSKSRLALYLDAYVMEGVFAGADTSLNLLKDKISLSLLGGVAYKPQVLPKYYYSSTYPSFRYGLYSKLDVNLSPFTIKLDLPLVSDPQFKYTYLNRITRFSFDSLLGTKQNFPSNYSSSDESTLTPTLSVGFSKPSSWNAKILSSLNLGIDASMKLLWKSAYTNPNSELFSFKQGEASLPTISFSIDGTIFDLKMGKKKAEGNNIDREMAKELEARLPHMSTEERLETELLIQRARKESYKTQEELDDSYIILDKIGGEGSSKVDENKLPEGFNTAKAEIDESKGSGFRDLFSSSLLSMTYSLNEEFSNTYLAPDNDEDFLGKGSIYSKTTGTLKLSGIAIKDFFEFSQELKPQFIYSKQENYNNQEIQDFDLTGTTSVQIPYLGLSWNLGMIYYKYKKTQSDITPLIIEKSGGTWDKANISSHYLSFSKSLFSNVLSLSLSGNLPPLAASISPSVKFAMKGFSLSGSHSMEGTTIAHLNNKKTEGSFGYSNSYVNTSISVLYDYTKQADGMHFLRPVNIGQRLSLTFFNSLVNISESVSFEGVSSSGISNYFSSINFSLSIGSYASMGLSLSGAYNDIDVTSANIRLTTGDLKVSFWMGRIVLGANVTGDLRLDFKDPFQNALTYSFALIFEIKELISLKVAINGSNNNIYKYFGGGTGSGPFSWGDLFSDLLRSINIFKPSGLKQTNFVLSGIDVSLSHDMGDWALSFTYTTDVVLEKNEWKWKPKYTILLQWTAIPELKVDKTIEQ